MAPELANSRRLTPLVRVNSNTRSVPRRVCRMIAVPPQPTSAAEAVAKWKT
jgi:hypothetical protein